MAKKVFTPEQIFANLRQISGMTASGREATLDERSVTGQKRTLTNHA